MYCITYIPLNRSVLLKYLGESCVLIFLHGSKRLLSEIKQAQTQPYHPGSLRRSAQKFKHEPLLAASVGRLEHTQELSDVFHVTKLIKIGMEFLTCCL